MNPKREKRRLNYTFNLEEFFRSKKKNQVIQKTKAQVVINAKKIYLFIAKKIVLYSFHG